MPTIDPSRPRILTAEHQELAAAHQWIARQQARACWRRQQGMVPLEELEGHALLVLTDAARLYEAVRGPFDRYLRRAVTRQLLRFVHTWRRGGRLDFPRFTDLTDDDGPAFDPADGRAADPSRAPMVAELLERVRVLLFPREWQILFWRHGLEWGLQECANELGVSLQRVRQIEMRAWERLCRLLPANNRSILLGGTYTR